MGILSSCFFWSLFSRQDKNINISDSHLHYWLFSWKTKYKVSSKQLINMHSWTVIKVWFPRKMICIIISVNIHYIYEVDIRSFTNHSVDMIYLKSLRWSYANILHINLLYLYVVVLLRKKMKSRLHCNKS